MCYDHLNSYLLLPLAWGRKRREELPSLREPGESQAERAVPAELCQAAQSGWMSDFERSLSQSVSFASTDCRTYLAFYHLNVQMAALWLN